MTKRVTHLPELEDAVDKYREFHRLEPLKVGAMSLELPSRLRRAGSAKWVTYRSSKVIPDTGERPRKPVDYIHEHDAGVVVYRPDGGELDTEVPQRIRDVRALTKLGQCLGFAYVDRHGKEIEAVCKRTLPELYCTPDGKALLVVQDKREVLAMMWGGALGVFARGIDG